MSPALDTAVEVLHRWPFEVTLWMLFALVPVLVPAVVATVKVPKGGRRAAFVVSSAARLVGYPVMLLLLLGVPWVVFEVVFVPVLLDAYPGSRSVLAVPVALSELALQHWFWAAPLAWLTWVAVATPRFARSWRLAHAVA